MRLSANRVKPDGSAETLLEVTSHIQRLTPLLRESI
jgi:hypothetical protein